MRASSGRFPQLVQAGRWNSIGGPDAVRATVRRGSRARSISPKRNPTAGSAGKGTIFALVYRRIVPRLGHAQAIGAITHRLCRLIWKILHERVRYEERGPAVSEEAKKVRARKMIRELRSLGYRVECFRLH